MADSPMFRSTARSIGFREIGGGWAGRMIGVKMHKQTDKIDRFMSPPPIPGTIDEVSLKSEKRIRDARNISMARDARIPDIVRLFGNQRISLLLQIPPILQIRQQI